MVGKDPTCRVPQLLKPIHLEPVLRNKRIHTKKKTWEYVKTKLRAMKENEKAQHKRKTVAGR